MAANSTHGATEDDACTIHGDTDEWFAALDSGEMAQRQAEQQARADAWLKRYGEEKMAPYLDPSEE